jgi:hypothetical protein
MRKFPYQAETYDDDGILYLISFNWLEFDDEDEPKFTTQQEQNIQLATSTSDKFCAILIML